MIQRKVCSLFCQLLIHLSLITNTIEPSISSSYTEDSEEEFMEITYRLSFTSQSPLQAFMGSIVRGENVKSDPHRNLYIVKNDTSRSGGIQGGPGMSEIERMKDVEQDLIEVIRESFLYLIW